LADENEATAAELTAKAESALTLARSSIAELQGQPTNLANSDLHNLALARMTAWKEAQKEQVTLFEASPYMMGVLSCPAFTFDTLRRRPPHAS
jgi:hypothetical protein